MDVDSLSRHFKQNVRTFVQAKRVIVINIHQATVANTKFIKSQVTIEIRWRNNVVIV